jgi:Hpt domain
MTAKPPPKGPISPQNSLRAPDLGKVAFSAADIASIDARLKEMQPRFVHLIGEQVERLSAAWAAATERDTEEPFADCIPIAHDLAGLGGTLGYSLVTGLARSLCRVLRKGDCRRPETRNILDAHIRALQTIAKNRIAGDGGPVGIALTEALNIAIRKYNQGETQISLVAPEQP